MVGPLKGSSTYSEFIRVASETTWLTSYKKGTFGWRHTQNMCGHDKKTAVYKQGGRPQMNPAYTLVFSLRTEREENFCCLSQQPMIFCYGSSRKGIQDVCVFIAVGLEVHCQLLLSLGIFLLLLWLPVLPAPLFQFSYIYLPFSYPYFTLRFEYT